MFESQAREAEAGGDILPAAPAQQTHTGIAILGSHPATVMAAPFGDPNWLIYACSPHNFEKRTLPRMDQWFEIHKPIQDKTRGYNYLKYLETLPLVWMRDREQMHHFPGARDYPEDELRKAFCPFLFNSSIAFMLAKAIVDCERQGIRQIGLWGILQSSEQEYAYQRPSTQYFIWEAARRGIKILAAAESRLFDIPPEIF